MMRFSGRIGSAGWNISLGNLLLIAPAILEEY
jgi:hypothetical protein